MLNRMPIFRPKSIKQHLMLWILLLLLPVLVVITFRSYLSISYFTKLANDHSLFRVALAVANQVHVVDGKYITTNLQETIQLLHFDSKDQLYYQILDADQGVIQGNARLPLPKTLPQAEKKQFYDAVFNLQNLRMVAFEYPIDATNMQRSVTIIVGETLYNRNAMQEDILAFFILSQIVIILLVVSAVNLAIKKGLISLEQLRAAILRRTPDDTSALASQDSPAELRPLVVAMNDLLVRIRGSVDEKQQFIANAAHQLKTPIAGLKLQLENAIREKNTTQINHALKQASIGVSHLDRLTKQLLSLARAEFSSEEYQTKRYSNVHLLRLVQDVCAEWVPIALTKNINIEVLAEGGVSAIEGDEILLAELLNNLLDNAIRYNPAGTDIFVDFIEDATTLTLMVGDNGVGIPEDSQANVWQRFYRVLSNSGNTVGCGLGLSIVQEIAKQHSAMATLSYTDIESKVGTLVKVRFQKTGS